jgi:hypothetical protein
MNKIRLYLKKYIASFAHFVRAKSRHRNVQDFSEHSRPDKVEANDDLIGDFRFSMALDDQKKKKLCELCAAMTVQQLRSREGYTHHAHARLLKEDAESPNGCPLCSIMWKNLVGPPPPETEEESTHKYLNMTRKPIFTRRSSCFECGQERSFLDDPIKVFLNPVGKYISDLQIYCAPMDLMQELLWDPASMQYFLRGEGRISDKITYPSPLELESHSRAKEKYPPVGVLTHSWSLERQGRNPMEYFMGQFRISVGHGK